MKQTGTRLPPMNEKQFTGQIKELATKLGWEFYHPWLSIHSPRGWPDVALCRPPRLILAELKIDAPSSQISESQEKWLNLLGQCPGVEVFVWRPRDFDRIAEILKPARPGQCVCFGIRLGMPHQPPCPELGEVCATR